MKKKIKYKLDVISNIYSNYLLRYRKCIIETRFEKDKPAYSFSEIMSYLDDTLDIITSKPKTSDFSSAFSYHISLLQAIYVQQDLTLEILYLTKCNLDKGKLKKDSDYYINRNLRNELVGHPIRKVREDGCEVLLSSVLMDIHSNSKTISYTLYHKDNNYQNRKLSFEISEIIERHFNFLNRYLDHIIEKLKQILENFSGRLSNLLRVVENNSFTTVIKLCELDFESILEIRYCYDSSSLKKIFEKRNDNKRYLFFIETFLDELKYQTNEIIQEIPFEFKERVWTKNRPPKIKPLEFADSSGENVKLFRPMTYHYELGKLSTKRNRDDFQFFSSLLRDKCKYDTLINEELDHMQNNIYNDIEYYSSLNLIRSKLTN